MPITTEPITSKARSAGPPGTNKHAVLLATSSLEACALDAARKRAWVLAALEECETRLVRYALRLLGDEGLARDVVQYAFLKLCDQEPGEHSPGPTKWLYAVVRNRSTDVLRTRGREQSLDEGAERFNSTSAWQPASAEPSGAETLERADTIAVVRCVVESLPAAQREAVDLWSEGFSYREMSSITGRPENTLRVMVHRTLVQLREHPTIKSLEH